MSNTAFVFPGQGSQSVGMLSELASHYPLVIDLFSSVSERLGYDVWALVQQGPEERLNQTEHTQVAVLTADVAVYKTLQQCTVSLPAMMAGHSLGEYAALVCADAISLPDAAALVARRGQLMQETVPFGQGAMAAIVGLTDGEVQSICAKASTTQNQVSPANYNAIGQVVIAGHTSAVEVAIQLADEAGARMAKQIPVSVPCHCSLLKNAADAFADDLQQAAFKVPTRPVISNVDMSVYQSADQIRALLTEQLYRPVRWVETIQLMKNNGIECIVECGPGKVLSGLVKRIDKSIHALSINDSASLDSAIVQLKG
jgi:[acyl-carrier-protein] S-malonyltransferase